MPTSQRGKTKGCGGRKRAPFWTHYKHPLHRFAIIIPSLLLTLSLLRAGGDGTPKWSLGAPCPTLRSPCEALPGSVGRICGWLLLHATWRSDEMAPLSFYSIKWGLQLASCPRPLGLHRCMRKLPCGGGPCQGTGAAAGSRPAGNRGPRSTALEGLSSTQQHVCLEGDFPQLSFR